MMNAIKSFMIGVCIGLMLIGIFSIIYGMFYGFIIKGYMKTVWQSDDTV